MSTEPTRLRQRGGGRVLRGGIRGEPHDPYAPPPRQDWRSEVAGASGLNILAGIWLIISPWIVGYTSDDHMWNPIVFGAIIGALAAGRAFGLYREAWLSWVNALIGAWLFASAFWLAQSSQASWNVGILGVIVFVGALWSASASEGRGEATA